MKGIEVARLVVEKKSMILFRPAQPGEFEIKPWEGEGEEEEHDLAERLDPPPSEGWVMLDLFSASMLTQVHAGLKPENQAKLEDFIAKRGLVAGVNLGWKVVNAATAKGAGA